MNMIINDNGNANHKETAMTSKTKNQITAICTHPLPKFHHAQYQWTRNRSWPPLPLPCLPSTPIPTPNPSPPPPRHRPPAAMRKPRGAMRTAHRPCKELAVTVFMPDLRWRCLPDLLGAQHHLPPFCHAYDNF